MTVSVDFTSESHPLRALSDLAVRELETARKLLGLDLYIIMHPSQSVLYTREHL